jgi:hypothetical protein
MSQKKFRLQRNEGFPPANHQRLEGHRKNISEKAFVPYNATSLSYDFPSGGLRVSCGRQSLRPRQSSMLGSWRVPCDIHSLCAKHCQSILLLLWITLRRSWRSIAGSSKK